MVPPELASSLRLLPQRPSSCRLPHHGGHARLQAQLLDSRLPHPVFLLVCFVWLGLRGERQARKVRTDRGLPSSARCPSGDIVLASKPSGCSGLPAACRKWWWGTSPRPAVGGGRVSSIVNHSAGGTGVWRLGYSAQTRCRRTSPHPAPQPAPHALMWRGILKPAMRPRHQARSCSALKAPPAPSLGRGQARRAEVVGGLQIGQGTRPNATGHHAAMHGYAPAANCELIQPVNAIPEPGQRCWRAPGLT